MTSTSSSSGSAAMLIPAVSMRSTRTEGGSRTPRPEKKGERGDLNPQPPDPQSVAYSTKTRRTCKKIDAHVPQYVPPSQMGTEEQLLAGPDLARVLAAWPALPE